MKKSNECAQHINEGLASSEIATLMGREGSQCDEIWELTHQTFFLHALRHLRLRK